MNSLLIQEDMRRLMEAWDDLIPVPLDRVIYVPPHVAKLANAQGIDLEKFYWKNYGAKVVIQDMMLPVGADNGVQ